MASAFRNQIFGDLVVCFAELENGWNQALTYFKSVLPESEGYKARAFVKLDFDGTISCCNWGCL